MDKEDKRTYRKKGRRGRLRQVMRSIYAKKDYTYICIVL